MATDSQSMDIIVSTIVIVDNLIGLMFRAITKFQNNKVRGSND